jgi:hypothetical protein
MNAIAFGAQYHFSNVLNGENEIASKSHVTLREIDPDKYHPNDLTDDVVVFAHSDKDLTFLTNMDYLKHAMNFNLLMTAVIQLKEKRLISQETMSALNQAIKAFFMPQPEKSRRY